MAELTDLELAVEQLKAKQRPYNTLFAYYEGPQPLKYSTKKLEEIFTQIDARFTNNWVSVAVGATVERLELQHFDVDGKAENDLNTLWTDTKMDADEEDIEIDMVLTSEAYAIAWKDEEDTVTCFRQDPRMCHVFYEPENPKKKQFAAKWWVENDKSWRLTLYYPDRLEYYGTDKKPNTAAGISAKMFKPLETNVAPNPFDVIPVVHFRLGGRKRGSAHDLIEPQDAFNKLLNDMMVSSEFGAFPQRYVISMAPALNLKSGPNVIWPLQAGDNMSQPTQVGQFPAADLSGYLKAMETQSTYIAIRSKAPKHYFFAQGGDPSGEALIASEAALNKHCKTIITKYLAPAYQELGELLLLLAEKAGAKVEPIFAAPETVLPISRANMTKTYTDSGAGLESAAIVSGHSPEEAERLARGDFVVLPAVESKRATDALQDVVGQSTNGASGELAAEQTPENLASGQGLNGAQIRAAIEILAGVTAGTVAELNAVELLVSLGIERDRAERMVDAAKSQKLDTEIVNANGNQT